MDPPVRKASVANIDVSRKAASGRRRILGGALAMFGVAVAIWLVSHVFAGEPRWAAFVAMAPLLARWALLIGAILLSLYFAVRKTSTTAIPAPPEDPMAFGQTTTMFHDGDAEPGKREPPAAAPHGPETEI